MKGDFSRGHPPDRKRGRIYMGDADQPGGPAAHRPAKLQWQVVTIRRGITESMDRHSMRKTVDEGNPDPPGPGGMRGITGTMDEWLAPQDEEAMATSATGHLIQAARGAQHLQ